MVDLTGLNNIPKVLVIENTPEAFFFIINESIIEEFYRLTNKIEMFMIPDDILETLTCRKCRNYLSARPIKVYPSRHVLCGRCTNDHDDGVVSLYDTLAQQGLFKCINRYEGCDKVLRYMEVLDHEKTCLSGQYKCSLCPTSESIGSLAFLHHFKENHKNSILTSTMVEISQFGEKFSKTFLYITNNFLFLINILMFRGIDHTQFIVLNSIPLGSKSLSEKIYQKFTLHTLNNGKKENKYVTRRKLCSPYCNKLKNKTIIANYEIETTQTLLIEFEMDIKNAQNLISLPSFGELHFDDNCNNIDVTPGCSKVEYLGKMVKFFITDEFKKMWSSKYKLVEDGTVISSLNRKIGFCCYCQNMFLTQSENSGIYKCLCTQCSTSNNLLCSKCYFFGVISCINGNSNPYQFAVEETAVFKTVQYFCRWGCGEHFYCWHLKLHELNCPSQSVRLCPVKACNSKHSGRGLIEHIRGHTGVIFHDDNLIKTSILTTENKNCVVVPLLNHYITIVWDKILLNTFSCSLFNIKNKNLGNLQPTACFKRNKRVDTYKDMFTLDVEEDYEILIILVNS